MPARVVNPSHDQILRFCAEDPVERVFLEDVARRSLGRFVGLAEGRELQALCHVGVNAVPSGHGCGAFAREARTDTVLASGASGNVTYERKKKTASVRGTIGGERIDAKLTR